MKNNYLIYGRQKGTRGGAFMGIEKSRNMPIFGGSNLIYACMFIQMTHEEVQKICETIKERFPGHECKPKLMR